ncbi:uncharacterized protein LTR77_003132 [Saxophila tyrrhenica]|uniref:ARID domain-containing protein n=1 Tax=Saxophila tyrrhenica TaxID=1690608 RepID=A0AAV9PL47_9PEZI|nr:hypothetical protein LTR77_003132 [Saxophila tyrrhenica]
MNQWANGQANGMFSQNQAAQGHLNPSQMYSNLGNGNANNLDLSQFTQGLQNGTSSSTPNPSLYPSQTFQPGSVIPAKRPHDGISGSPVQGQGSRAQTPNFGGAFSNQQAGQQFPTPYAHLQQQAGSNNATPSPTMSNQQFRPPTQPQQRMQNASPSPFPQQQQQGGYGNQMSPANSQISNLPTSMPQQNPMAGFNQQFGMGGNSNMGMAGMGNSAQGQLGNNMGNMRNSQQIQQMYQQRLLQQTAEMRNRSMMQRPMGAQQNQAMNNAGQQRGTNPMANGQAGAQMNASALQVQQHQQKRASFINTLKSHALQQNKHFDEHPIIAGRPVDYLMLWTATTQLGGSARVEQSGLWPNIAARLGFPQNVVPMAAEELKQLHNHAIGYYERAWFAARQQGGQASKQEQARMHAHQMAGVGGPDQASPTKMQAGMQQSQLAQFQQNQQQQAQATPIQANAQLPQNGMVTPQQQQQMLQHRRNSSLRKPEQMTPQGGAAAPSPMSAGKAPQRSPSVKQEAATSPLAKEAPQSKNYVPAARTAGSDGSYGGLDVPSMTAVGEAIARHRPDMPSITEMGLVDTRAITLSLASGIHAEVRYALDTLAMLSNEHNVAFDLEKCEDLMDVIVDCAEEQVDKLSDEAVEVSDALDLAPYEDIMRASRAEAETLQEVHTLGTKAYDLDRVADKVIAITTILRNFSFYEHNHRLLTQSSLLKWLSDTIRLLGTRNMLLRTFYNTQDFYKDMIIFLSNITQSLELPSRDDALHILHFLLAFAPQPAPSYSESGGKISFSSFAPLVHRYLPPAVDCLAKLLARQDPNRMLYKSIFTASSSSLAISESPLDLLTRAFALSISVLPNRVARQGTGTLLRIVEARKAYLTQGMLAADILTSLMPGNEPELARAWVESEDGWATGLLSLAAVLSVDKQQQHQPMSNKPRDLGLDHDTFRLIAHRALTMMKRLVEKAGKVGAAASQHQQNGAVNGSSTRNAEGEEKDSSTAVAVQKWNGVPTSNVILGALTHPDADKTALRLLCGLFEMSMQQAVS